jgi:hypothetical protein
VGSTTLSKSANFQSSYFPPPLSPPPAPDFWFTVPRDESAWLLVEPGTTVLPVAPGVVLFMAEPL